MFLVYEFRVDYINSIMRIWPQIFVHELVSLYTLIWPFCFYFIRDGIRNFTSLASVNEAGDKCTLVSLIGGTTFFPSAMMRAMEFDPYLHIIAVTHDSLVDQLLLLPLTFRRGLSNPAIKLSPISFTLARNNQHLIQYCWLRRQIDPQYQRHRRQFFAYVVTQLTACTRLKNKLLEKTSSSRELYVQHNFCLLVTPRRYICPGTATSFKETKYEIFSCCSC